MGTRLHSQAGYTSRAILLLALLLTSLTVAYFMRANESMQGKQKLIQRQDAAAYELLLQERLRIADHALELIARAPRALALPQISAPYFKNINLIDDAGQITPVAGTPLHLPDQTEAIRIRLEREQPALLTLSNQAGTPKIVLLRGFMQENNRLGVISAELSPEFLWHNDHGTPNHLLVVGHEGQALYSSEKHLSAELLKTLQKPTRSVSGSFYWKTGDDRGHASYLTMSLHQQYATDDWIVVAYAPPVSIIARAGVWDWLMAAGVIIALILVWAVVLRLSKKARLPESQPHDTPGTQLVVAQPLDIVRSMDEFDRAILSNASFNNMIDLVFTHAPKVIPCLLVAVTHFDDSTPGQQSTLVNTLDETQSIELPKLDAALKQNLDTEPNGYLIENPEKHPFIKPLAALGVARFHLFPVYRDSALSAILHFGLPEGKWLSEGEHHYARAFADRLGVALTSVMRGKELYIQEHFDPVTGLPNRTFCRDRLSQEISRARRKQLLVGIIYINLAGFKKINDSLGYVGGDAILNEVAQRLKSTLRESDVIARFANDEFVIVLPDLNNANETSKVAGKLVDAFAQNFSYEGHNTHLNAAMGIALYPNDGQSVDHLFQHAEMAMTRIKSSGHTQYAFYEEHMNSKAVERLKLEHDLRQAVNSDDQLFLVYQPQIDLRTGKIAGVEALVRWNHPIRGLVNPGEFISIAEETGLIIKMSETIRHIACKQYVEWTAKGVAPPRIAVNISSQDLRRKTFSEEVLATLKQYEVPTSAIELEITESMFVDASGGVVEVLRNLQGEGFLIAIDDFGTGYSSLSYLGLLPFDILKVDRSFVLGIGKPAEKIVSVIVDVAHTFEKKVIAEGVDSEHQHQYLADLGCEIIQGFLFSKPLKAAEFEQYAVKMAA